MEIWDYPFPPHRASDKCPQGLCGNIDKTEANTQQINMRWVTNDLIFPVWGLAWNEPMEVQFQFRAATSVSLQPEKVKYHTFNSAGTAAGAAQPQCQAVEEVRMWWGTRISPSFTWRVKEGIFHRMGTGRELKWLCVCALTGGAAPLQPKGDWGQVPYHLWWHGTGVQDSQPQILYFKPLANALKSMKGSRS